MYYGYPSFWPIAYQTDRLAPMETLMLHELIVMETARLLELKRRLGTIDNETLKQLTERLIALLEKNIREAMSLLQYRAVFPS
ncbi:MAG: hypothetical protein IMW86_04960 [Hydrogenibacillus sp.]|nr:hypothetical protein [Hydrogenibacillus sp.]